MGVMTTQQLLPLTPAGAVLIGDAAALVTDDDGGRVFIRGELCNAWDAGDDLGRRLAAVQLVRIKAARAMQGQPRSGSPPSPCGAGARSLTPPVPRALPRTSAAPRDHHG